MGSKVGRWIPKTLSHFFKFFRGECIGSHEKPLQEQKFECELRAQRTVLHFFKEGLVGLGNSGLEIDLTGPAQTFQ